MARRVKQHQCREEHLGEEVAGGLAAAAGLHAVPVEGVVPRLRKTPVRREEVEKEMADLGRAARGERGGLREQLPGRHC
eukprot:3345073-Rhodomonas_salina.2